MIECGEQFPERNIQIRNLRRQGVAPREIARRLSLPPGTVSGVLNRAGMSKEERGRGHAKLIPTAVAEIRRRKDAGEGASRLAIEFDVSPETIRDVAARRNFWARR